MRTARSEAIDIFRRWFADGLPVRWQGSFAKFAFASWGRIVSVDDRELRAMSDNKESELVVQFTPELEFGYGDSRVVTGEEEKFEECILIFFSPVPDEGNPDLIALAALKPTRV